jgi:hypothetical protein
MPPDEDANKDPSPVSRSTRSGAKPHSTAPNARTPSGSSSHWSVQATGTTCRWQTGQTRRTTRGHARYPDWDAKHLQADEHLKAQRAHEPFAFLHQTEKVTTNGDNKNKPPNITDTPHNHILYTSTISQTQTSELDYIIHDNKREHTTAIFTNDKSKQHNQPKPPKTKWRKRIRKTPNKTLNRYFIFDERTYFNELDQSTPISDNYKNSEICKH